MGWKAGEQVGLVWDRGKPNRREKFSLQSQSRAVHEVLRAILQITFNGSPTAPMGFDWKRSPRLDGGEIVQLSSSLGGKPLFVTDALTQGWARPWSASNIVRRNAGGTMRQDSHVDLSQSAVRDVS